MNNENSKKGEAKPGEQKNAPSQGGGNDHGHNNQITVKVRFEADTVPVTINVNESITALLEQAMIATGNNSIPKDRFKLKLGDTVLDPRKKVSDYPIVEGSLLVLVLEAGGGGNY